MVNRTESIEARFVICNTTVYNFNPNVQEEIQLSFAFPRSAASVHAGTLRTSPADGTANTPFAYDSE